MTNGARPNLGGLFNGSTPPQRGSRIADAAGPRLIRSVPIREMPSAPPAGLAEPTEQIPVSRSAGSTSTDWLDPVAAVNQYFDLLRTLLDANQRWAVACVGAVTAVAGRVGRLR